MIRTMLFSVAKEAKSSIPKILSLPENPFLLVESKKCPDEESGLKDKLADNEDFDTAFDGTSASVEDCQNWLMEQQDTAMFIEPNIIGIADGRTAKDHTILMTWYREMGEDSPPYGRIPPKDYSWWDFRVYPEQAHIVVAYLKFVKPDVTFPLYFGRKEEFTNENGVFDAVKAEQALKDNVGTL